jgi:hypothetical protein
MALELIGKVDDHARAEEEQNDGTTDSEPRIDLSPGTRLQADGKQTCRAVDEGRDEGTEDNLGRTIPKKVAQ